MVRGLSSGREDANEFLVKFGAADLRIYIEEDAKEWPVEGVYGLLDIPEPEPLVLWRPRFPEWNDRMIARGAKDFLGFLAFLPHGHFFFFFVVGGFGLRFGFDFFGPPKMPGSFSGPDKMPGFLGPLKIAMAPSSCSLRGSPPSARLKHRPAARAKQEMLINLLSVNTPTVYGVYAARYRRETHRRAQRRPWGAFVSPHALAPLPGRSGAFCADQPS